MIACSSDCGRPLVTQAERAHLRTLPYVAAKLGARRSRDHDWIFDRFAVWDANRKRWRQLEEAAKADGHDVTAQATSHLPPG